MSDAERSRTIRTDYLARVEGERRAGNLTAFVETRTVDPHGIEVGLVSGLGMLLWNDGASYLANSSASSCVGGGQCGDGRIEFEQIGAVSIELGNGGNDFSIGGDSLLGTGAGKLPAVRQENIVQFVHTPTAMVSISSGTGNDTMRVFSTNHVDRAGLNSQLNLLSVGAATPGGGGSTNETLTVSQATGGNGYYTLKYRYQETKPIPFDATATDVQNALQALLLLGADVSVTDNTVSGSGQLTYTVSFDSSIANVQQLVAQVAPLTLNGGNKTLHPADNNAGDNTFNVQSLFEDTFVLGGNQPVHHGDTMNFNVHADTTSPFTVFDVTPHLDLGTTSDNKP